ncbi:MAG TPA: NAD-dependent epimerase/dehydratase family protein [Candidatus Bathyarchaeia archaeon]|nr:NAD-dependent epimerase/dehydratase family protein [Candidatus Bathyarchaeia archaeon]
MKRILVTGGFGFIGSNFIDDVISKAEVTVLDDLSSGLLGNVSQQMNNPRFRFVRGSVLDHDKIEEALEGVDAVVHLAAVVSVARSREDPYLVHRVNVEGTLNVLEACLKHSIDKLIFASSAAVYGNELRFPSEEELGSNPSNLYGATKAAGEAYVRAYNQTHGLKTVILRLMNVYGPRRSPGPYAGVMAQFAEAIRLGKPLTVYGDGEQTRDFVYVSDVTDAMASVLRNDRAIGHTFNIGTGSPSTINMLATIFSKMRKPNSPIHHEPPRPGEVRASCANIEKARKVLGYSPKVSLKQGIQLFMDWRKSEQGKILEKSIENESPSSI